MRTMQTMANFIPYNSNEIQKSLLPFPSILNTLS